MSATKENTKTPADHVRELVGDLFIGCEFRDGPQQSLDSQGNKYKYYAIGAGQMVPHNEREAVLNRYMRTHLAGTAFAPEVCEVRSIAFVDRLESDQTELYVTLSFFRRHA